MTTIKITDYLDGFQYLSSPATLPPIGGGSNGRSLRAVEPEAFSIELEKGTLEAKTPDLQFFPTAEGYYDYIRDQYIYQYKDHLGNARVSFGRNSTGALEITDANDYYPFGMNHLKTGNSFFGQGSYKNYKFQEQELQETGFYSFKWRQYMPDVGRFFNVDPLAEKYTFNSTYAFSENRVIDAGEFEGLEKVLINKGTKNLIIAVKGWQGGNPDPGKTQTKHYGAGSFIGALKDTFGNSKDTFGNSKDTQIAVFDSSMNSRTPNDISASIKDFRSANPDGKLILAGHSLGGDDVVDVINENSSVKVDKTITIDFRTTRKSKQRNIKKR